ncbi:MAG TPA: biotin--[acetyl-CoA-carboxylase] ligase, partial [Candidatus Omnitrophica bacterium]|nr:biotin--[acetyl-CoA-carboxylase] ligase [Candidatus Omnitrophota bacterium]
MDKEILRIFRENPGNYMSGEQMSQNLGISRAALWKHIEKLRQKGYVFQAVPNLGYSLVCSPDRLFPEEVESLSKNNVVGKKIIYYDIVDSTNRVCYELAEKGYPEGTVVVAEGQSKGRGRMRRQWISPKYAGIYFSVILKPDILPTQVPKITLLSAVSIALAIKRVTGLPANIKWPNDILVNRKKVCGILTEMDAETDMVRFVVLGIGINVNTDVLQLPPEASSLSKESDAEVSRIELLTEVLSQIETHYFKFQKQGFASITKEWENLSGILGERIRVHLRGKETL